MKYLKPDKVSKPVAKIILNFFNSAETAEEIAEVIEIPERRDIGMKIANNILEIRNQKGDFTDLKQIDEISYIGPKRFTYIINSLKNDKQFKEKVEMKIENENEPLIKFESDVSAPILRYDLPSPSSYEGKVYIETDIGDGYFNEETAKAEPDYQEILSSNKDEINEYLLNSRRQDLEKDLSPFLIVDKDLAEEVLELEYPATYTFDKQPVGTKGTNIDFVDSCSSTNHTIIHEGIGGHSNVLLQSSNNSQQEFTHNFKNPEYPGVREFWIRIEQGNFTLHLIDNNSGKKIQIKSDTERGILWFNFGPGWGGGARISKNRWYHIKLNWKNNLTWVWIDKKSCGGWGTHRDEIFVENFRIIAHKNSKIYIDAFGDPNDPNYTIGDNFAGIPTREALLDFIQKYNTEYHDLLEDIEEEVDDQGNITNFALETKNKLFSYYIQTTLNIQSRIPIFYRTMSGKLQIKFVDVPREAKPRTLFVETHRLTNFPGDYGAGTTIKTFSLLPRETTEISIKTWKKTSIETKRASSVLDSYTEEKADEFGRSIQKESARSSKVDKSLSYSVKASASVNWGWGSASVKGGVEGSAKSAREEAAKSVMNANRKHAQSASAKREVNIDTSFEKSVETGIETSIMRKIRNLNVTRTLNFTFRQMNQQFHSILHLTDLRIAFYNGYPGSYREYALNEIGELVHDFMIDEENSYEYLKSKILEAYGRIYDELGNPIEIQGNVIDYLGKSRALIEEIDLKDGNRPYLRVIPPLNGKGEPLGQQDYIMRQKTSDHEADIRYLDGIILANESITMKTDGVIVEALMGRVNALDNYSYNYRREKIRNKKYENKRIKTGIDLVEKLIDKKEYEKAIIAYKETFGVEPGIDAVKGLFTYQMLESSK